VQVCDERGRAVASDLARWLAAAAPARARGAVNVALVSDARVRQLNRAYRHKDHATDVLSFPAFAPAPPNLHPPPPKPHPPSSNLLGDVVIARGVARRQARRAGHSEGTEIRVLALHGLLHLLGYDHEIDAGEMAAVERRLRRKAGLRDGLIERARSRTGSGRRR
jgi:probable rRNA maturation factor